MRRLQVAIELASHMAFGTDRTMIPKENDARRKGVCSVHKGGVHKREKEAIIPAADAGHHPWTMVIKPIHTIVAHRAVLCAWWTVYVTRSAPFVNDAILDDHRFRIRVCW